MRRSVAALVIVFIGAAVMELATSGTYLRYVKPGMRWMLLAAGVVLIALAVTDVLVDGRKKPAQQEQPVAMPEDAWRDAPWPAGRRDEEIDHSAHADHGHGHHGLPRTAWLLLIPIFALLVIDPPALGADAAERQSPVSSKPANPKSNAWMADNSQGAPPVAVPVTDYAIWAVWQQDTMKGRRYQLTGFVTPAKNGVWYVTRIGITCCVADGTAYMVEARGQAAPPKNQWVTVTGLWAEPTKRPDGDVAALTVETLKPVAMPVNPYE
ncbi:TIGR03943 family protein [Kribbella capetownensis]|uniref:TIGR03943 family protein n=1 Tax=Kribbella capetownensis TaxID=1572659 RepID=A0A4R0JVL8_9ACTN|nr:TIGR03943 family protein [Kribbella capetownensis]TCC50657.1 TIGR03943 family protein [Kribbella capetownensis]